MSMLFCLSEVNVRILSALLGISLILFILWEAFEAIVLPRRVTRKFRLTRFFYRNTWRLWSSVFRALSKGKRQETYLSYFGPLSLLLLLSIWAAGLIFGFALLNWGFLFPLKTFDDSTGFATYLYLSGTTFFTLGLGDVAPLTPFSRALTVAEAGLGFGFLALVIGYLPGLNQSFSRREVNISLLDARAGSPPSAAEMLSRRCHEAGTEELLQHLSEWERWAAELLESHLSYPVLAYFRSQHDNQSWLAALTTILDTSAFVQAAMEGACARQARLTFAMARHTIVDLSLIFKRPPYKAKRNRLAPEEFAQLYSTLAGAGLPLRKGDDIERELGELRGMYEPYVGALSSYLRMSVPPWISESGRRDNWEKSGWEQTRELQKAAGQREEDEHF